MRKVQVLPVLLVGLYIVWLTFSIASFFVVNKPFGANTIENMAAAFYVPAIIPSAIVRALLDLGAAAWIWLAGTGVGLVIWNRVLGHESDSLTRLILASGLGLGAIALLMLALGLAGVLSRLELLLILGLLTILTAPKIIVALRAIQWSRPPRLIAFYLVLTLGAVVTIALLPPTSWDGLFYHLKGPKLFIQQGAIRPGIDIPHLNFPSLLEMLFLLAMQIRGDVTARLIHLIYALLLGSLTFLVASRTLRVKNAWLALLFLYSTPIVLTLSAWAYNDLALAYYSFAAVFSLIYWDRTADNRWLAICGLMSGLLMGLKYTSAVIVIFITITILWRLHMQQRRSLRPLIFYIGPAFALVLPWLAKNWLFTGNPVYPFLFGGQFWDAFRAASYGEAGTGIGLDPVALLRLPYDMTLGFADASQEGTIGPFYLIFLPFLLFYGLGRRTTKIPAEAKLLLSYALFCFGFWVVGVINSAALYQARLYLPGLVALCPVVAWIIEDISRFDRPSFSLQRFLKLVIAFVVFLLFINQVANWMQIRPLTYLSGSETRSEYLERRLGAHYLIMNAINSELPKESVVLFLWEPRSYYCDLDCRPDSILDRYEHLGHLYADAESVVAAWRTDNISHVLVFESGLDFLLASDSVIDLDLLRSLRTQYLTPEASVADTYTLYRLTEND